MRSEEEVRKKKKKKKSSKNKKYAPTMTSLERRRLRRKRRRRAAMINKIAVAAVVLVVVGGGGAFVWNLPEVKLSRELKTAEQYIEASSYIEAIESCENALKIDSTSVEAYRTMAGTYLDMEDGSSAKQVLYAGWENTHDEGLMKYYCTLILNEGVAEINSEDCTFETIQKFLTVLEQDHTNADAISLMNTAYDWVSGKVVDESLTYFYDEDLTQETCQFSIYEDVMSRLILLKQNTGDAVIQELTVKFAMFPVEEMRMSRHHVNTYREMLRQVSADGTNQEVDALKACLDKEEQIQTMFAGIFAEFDAGNLEAAKDFIVTQEYMDLRDRFIVGEMEYWNGATYIPLSRETVILRHSETGWTFEYPEFEQQENTAGIITVYGNKMTDEGVQRSCIAYEPADTEEGYYPHTEYLISYMFSNVQKKNAFEAELNYHLETRIWTEDNMTTEMIGDWGGPYEWRKTY